MSKAELIARIVALRSEVALAEAELDKFDSSLVHNQYDNHDEAERLIRDRHEKIAGEDCKGSYNCGQSAYKQVYQVFGDLRTFEATTSFEYNRHDKTYYYIESQSYSFAPLESATKEVEENE